MSVRRVFTAVPAAGRLLAACHLQTRMIAVSAPLNDRSHIRKRAEMAFKIMSLGEDQTMSLESLKAAVSQQQQKHAWNSKSAQHYHDCILTLMEAVGLKPGDSWSIEDYSDAMTEKMQEKEIQEAATNLLQALFKAFDMDKDGYVDRLEWGPFLQMLSLNPKDAEAAFGGIDKDRNWKLSMEEFVAYALEHWYTGESKLGTNV